jgi:hypothetical protein
MDIAAILIGAALAILAGVYIAQPLLRTRRWVAAAGAESPRESLEAEYHATLDAIRDLDFDFRTGKLLEKDYRALRERYVAEGAGLLKELDQFAARAPTGSARTRRKPAPAATDDIEAMVQARRKSRSPRACPACGQPYQPGDRFCGKCGAALDHTA